MENLAAKYRPRVLDDVTEQGVVVDIVRNICKSKEITNRNFLFIGPAGTGKAEKLTNPILTTTGFRMMKDLQIGDEVFTGQGNKGKVSGIFPQGKRPIYKITLSDRTSIEVSDEHLNVFYRYNEDKKKREDYCMTTVDMIDFFNKSRFKLRIDVPHVDWDAKPLPVDPYLVGALIGDGSLSSGNFAFSNSEEDVVEKVDSILRRDWGKMLKKCSGDNVDYSITSVNYSRCRYVFTYKGETYNGCDALSNKLMSEGYPKFDGDTLYKLSENRCPNILKHRPELISAISCQINDNYKDWTEGDPLLNALRSMNLLCKSSEKRIPKEYLMNSRENRIALLQGLFDTDGYTDKGGSTVFTTCSNGLSEDFSFLVRSLGIRDTVISYPSRYKSKGEWIYTGTTGYDHNLKIPNELDYCTSDKHVARRSIRQNSPMRNVESIEYVGDEECQCIMIDHPDHTYISTEGFIPTHNTTTARIVANELNEGKGEPIEVDAASNSGVESVRSIIEQMRINPIGSKYKVFILDEVHSFSSQAWQALLKTLEEQPAKTIVCMATTNPEKIPATILSRVQTFQLSKISLEGIYNRLKYVIEQENKEGRGITYEDDAVLYIAKMAQGGMRSGISLLDKALSFDTHLTIQSLEKSLGLPNYDDYFSLLNAIVKKDNQKIVEIINNVYNSGVNFVKWFDGFFSFITNIVKFIYLQDIQKTMIPGIYEDKIKKYTTTHAALCLKLSNKLVKMNQELKTTQYLQELAISYLCSVPQVQKG